MFHPLHVLHASGFKSAIIAGGAIRDTYHNKPVRDIDLYIWSPETSNEHTTRSIKDVLKQLDASHPTRIEPIPAPAAPTFYIKSAKSPAHQAPAIIRPSMGTDCGESIYDTAYISGVIPCTIKGQDFEFIITSINPILYVNDFFDIGLCKCYSDGHKIQLTSDFIEDSLNKTLTIVGKDMHQCHIDYTMQNHVPKLQEKYPNYPIRYAPHNMKYAVG
jgi:hypothetical protein